MATLVESMSIVTSEKTDEKHQMHSVLNKSSHRSANPAEKSKLTGCDWLQKKCFGEDARPTAGMCMIAFAVPLLIPGVTLTAVAFDDETGFAKYSALHIIGMVMLAIAILLIIVGVFFNIRFKSKVGPEEHLHTVSTHEKLGEKPKQNPKKESWSLHSVESPTALPVNFMADSGHNLAAGDQHVHFNATKVGARSSLDALPSHSSTVQESQRYTGGDYSSSYDSSDSEDYSSGSYVISEEVEDGKPLRYVSEEGEITDTDDPKSTSNFTAPRLQMSERDVRKSRENKASSLTVRQITHSVSDTHIGDTDKNLNNFFRDSFEQDLFFTTKESLHGQRFFPSRTSEGFSAQKNSKESTIENASSNLSPGKVKNSEESQTSDKGSPGSRQRLQALSSDALASPSEDCEHNGVLSEESSSDSNSSVFSEDKELHANDILSQKTKKGGAVHSDSEVNDHVIWEHAQQARTSSSPAPQPLPKRVRLSESSGAITKDNSLGQQHSARSLDSRFIFSDKTPSRLPPLSPVQSTTLIPRKHEFLIKAQRAHSHRSTSSLTPLDSPELSEEESVSEPKPLPKKKLVRFSSSSDNMGSSLLGSVSQDVQAVGSSHSTGVNPRYNEPVHMLHLKSSLSSPNETVAPENSKMGHPARGDNIFFSVTSLQSQTAPADPHGVTHQRTMDEGVSTKRKKKRKKKKKNKQGVDHGTDRISYFDSSVHIDHLINDQSKF